MESFSITAPDRKPRGRVEVLTARHGVCKIKRVHDIFFPQRLAAYASRDFKTEREKK